ncbi:MAG: sensor histidine kinase [Comamonadaceae bacterium]|nr:MAG: sensor histidine kinase [Comamonadaceae bacterium]
MPFNHPLAFLGRLLTTAAFCCLVALALTVGGKGAWDVNLAFSLPIGLISWLVMDGGRALLTRGRTTPWPRGPVGWLLVAAGTAAGFLGGSAIGRWYADSPGSPWQDVQGHGALPTLVITVAASVAISFYFHSRGKAQLLQAQAAQAQRDAAQARLTLLQAQLEPHMLFNTLANLRVLVATDPARAQNMLDHLIDYLRATLGASRTTWHPLADEFARLADYLALMAVRMGPRLAFTLDLPEDLRHHSVPALLLQPLVENAIRHGLEPQVQGGEITVRARLLPGSGNLAACIELRVTDSGAGLSPAFTAGASHTEQADPAGQGDHGSHFGLQQVRERLATLYGTRASLALSPHPPRGTCARVLLPLHAPAP